MAFTRKHYERIAKAIREQTSLDMLVRELADMFAQDNPRFDRRRFADACKPETGGSKDG